MTIEPELKTLNETRVVGKSARMSLQDNTTEQLWREFMPLRKDIEDALDASLWSVEVYPDPDFFQSFDPSREFEKWAAVPVATNARVPPDLEELQIPAGRYAVFTYRGRPHRAYEIYRYIYGTWIPGSDYVLDHRPHLACPFSGGRGG